MGIISPVGHTKQALLEAIREGRSGIRPITAFDATVFRTSYGGEVVGFEPTEWITSEELELFPSNYLRFALGAARSALKDAGLRWSRDNPPSPRVGLVVGTCNGGLETSEEYYRQLFSEGPDGYDRKKNLLVRYHAVGKALSYGLGVSGPTWVVTTACSSSTVALAVAQELIAHGIVHTVLVGGTDAMCLTTMSGFDSLKATSTGKVAPFSVPAGLNLGEGAAFWVLEEAGAAKKRKAEIQGELLGNALTADAHHPTAPDPRGDGAYRTMNNALARAGIAPGDLGCINAHGTGTEANDRTESKAVSRLLGSSSVPVYSVKSQVGHCLGAAGIIEATAGLLSMQHGIVPATINFSDSRPGCNLDFVKNTPRKANYNSFLSCNYAFGGNNAGVVVGKYDEENGTVGRQNLPAVRTVLSGGSAVTSLGLGMDSLLAALQTGDRGLVSVKERVAESKNVQLAGLVQPFQGQDVDRRLNLKSMNRIGRYATAAARLALKETGIRVGPREGLETGVINGVHIGPDEDPHMRAVVSSNGAEADIGTFSQIVANATAGWVSTALLLKGYTATVSQGVDAGLFSILLAHLAVTGRSAPRVLAGASDQINARNFLDYDKLDFLYTGEEESRYGLRLEEPDKRVLGEGAAYIVAEELEGALERNAEHLVEIVGYGMSTDTAGFYEPSLDSGRLVSAIDQALHMAGWQPQQVGLVVWSPQGNAGDRKTLDGLAGALGEWAEEVPLVTSVFHTGLCEATSGTITLAAVLGSWARGKPLWPQITGVEGLDGRELPRGPVSTLAIATSTLGFNLVLALSPVR
jgi:3-oxoacyl-[acyl-carrier-protein] synthase II